jgi:hypothetical protein
VIAIELRKAPYHFQLWEIVVPQMEHKASFSCGKTARRLQVAADFACSLEQFVLRLRFP